jgi:hypothetical protein
MRDILVGAGSLRKLNLGLVRCLPTEDIKPALITQKQTLITDSQNPHLSNNARAGFKRISKYSINGFYLRSVNEPAPTKTTKTLCVTSYEKEMK